METNLQTNCFNCSRPLTKTGYFCGGCLIQVKCKYCNSTLEKDAAGCVNCGTPKEVRAETKAGSNQNINTFRMHETATDRIIEATFSDDVAKDLAGTLRDAAAAGRMRAIASNIPSSNNFNGADDGTTDFADAEVVSNENPTSQSETSNTGSSTAVTNPESLITYPHIDDLIHRRSYTEIEWILVFAFYESQYGQKTFTYDKVRTAYLDKRKKESRIKNFSSNWAGLLKTYFRTVSEGVFQIEYDKTNIISDFVTGKITGIIKGVFEKKNRSKSISAKKTKEENTSAPTEKSSKPSSPKRLKILSNINFEPAGKESLKDFFNKYTPANDNERNLLFVHYLQNVLEIDQITFSHIYSCYDILGLRISESLQQTIRNTASRTKWIETQKSILSVTIKGSNQIKAWNK
ncbi:hypothetical protein CHU00_11840 [Sphingobacterium cellulitidis]|uniref:zinc ribbon domain-containing protein n=1 Tax=Sphingobacterium cellulitidis TaxID=1768011 RepID=UPI000B93C974|nr:zinc ribbon domain-containing protein [Sphingobacterium cellulitidis]OYD45331.1 hypothetical protein CHU00_11840 [Sphingobacterium cellulitidis]